MPGNRKALEAGTIVSRKMMFCVVNKIKFFPRKCGAVKMWLHDKLMKPFEKLQALYNFIQISSFAAGQAHFRGPGCMEVYMHLSAY